MPDGQEHLRTEEDLEAILRLAVRNSPVDGDLRDRLNQSAAELGITPEQLAAAEAEYGENKRREEEQRRLQEAHEADLKRFRSYRWSVVWSSVMKFVPLIILLNFINFASSNGHGFKYWAIWPTVAFGIIVLGRFLRTALTPRHELERRFQKWRIKNGVLNRVEQFVSPKDR